jgi:cytochrome oxidase assembly protein ShyY1
VVKKFFEFTAIVLLAAIFVGLGLWQLDRARSLKEILNAPPPPVSAPVALAQLAEPRAALDKKNDSKPVNASGFYVANFKSAKSKRW